MSNACDERGDDQSHVQGKIGKERQQQACNESRGNEFDLHLRDPLWTRFVGPLATADLAGSTPSKCELVHKAWWERRCGHGHVVALPAY